MRTKRCNKCNTEKPISAFHVRSASHDGLQAYCKACRSVDDVQRRPERRLRSHGLSQEDYAVLLAGQDGRCAICGTKKDLGIDHDHATGEVRGILCRACNAGIGLLGDTSGRLALASEYLSSRLTWPI